jgi:hypothetical protein
MTSASRSGLSYATHLAITLQMELEAFAGERAASDSEAQAGVVACSTVPAVRPAPV